MDLRCKKSQPQYRSIICISCKVESDLGHIIVGKWITAYQKGRIKSNFDKNELATIEII